jgi:hypothetical protein
LLAALVGVEWFRELVQRLMRLMKLHARHLPRKSHYSHAGKLQPPLERSGHNRFLQNPNSPVLEKMRNGFKSHARAGREERHRRRNRMAAGKPQSGGLPDLQMAFAELWECMNTEASAPFMWSILYLMHYITFQECEEDADDDDDSDEEDFPHAPRGGSGRAVKRLLKTVFYC